MQLPHREDGDATSANGSGKDDSSQESAEEKEDVRESVAGVVQALTELASVQTPASVWLPSKHLTVQLSGKASAPFPEQNPNWQWTATGSTLGGRTFVSTLLCSALPRHRRASPHLSRSWMA